MTLRGHVRAVATPASWLVSSPIAARRGTDPRGEPDHPQIRPGGRHAGSYSPRRCSMNRRTVVPKPSRRNQVGTPPAARTSTRWYRSAAEKETPAELTAAAKTNLRARVDAAPLDAWRWCRRMWDYTAGPAATIVTAMGLGALWLLAKIPLPWWVEPPSAALGRFCGVIVPFWVTAILTGIAVGRWTWIKHHSRYARTRWLDEKGAPVRNLFRPRPTTIAIQQLEHRRTDLCRIPPGHSVDQYQQQEKVATDALGWPVTIYPARPGVMAVTQTYRDLLATPVPWRDDLNVDPEAIWLGINRDGRDVTAPLTRDGSGMAWFFAGAPDSGKSAQANSTLAQVVQLPPPLRRLWIIDPADGVDLGVWHPFAFRLATNPVLGLQLLRDLVAEMEGIRPRMTEAGIDKCVPSAEFPWDVLVIDELPELTLNEDKKTRDAACALLARIRRVGRKTNTSIIAITQDLQREVVPKAMSKIFSHRACFGVSTYTEVDMIVPGARKHGVHPEHFDPNHHGRFCWWDRHTYTEVRGVGLYGTRRGEVVRKLSVPRPETVQHVNGHRPQLVQANGTNSSRPYDVKVNGSVNGVKPKSERTNQELKVLLKELGDKAGRLGCHVPTLCVELGEPDWRLRRAFNQLGYVKRSGNFIAPEAAR